MKNTALRRASAQRGGFRGILPNADRQQSRCQTDHQRQSSDREEGASISPWGMVDLDHELQSMWKIFGSVDVDLMWLDWCMIKSLKNSSEMLAVCGTLWIRETKPKTKAAMWKSLNWITKFFAHFRKVVWAATYQPTGIFKLVCKCECISSHSHTEEAEQGIGVLGPLCAILFFSTFLSF